MQPAVGDRVEGYKLFRLRKDGTLGSLFINAKERYEVGKTYKAGFHPHAGFAPYSGFHLGLSKPPHLKEATNRVWARVSATIIGIRKVPASHGGIWLLGDDMTILELLERGT